MVAAKTAGAAPPQHYLWWFPGSPVKVHLALSVVERLKQRLSDTGASSSEEGLLFGGTRDGSTEILDFQPATNTSAASMVPGLTADRKRSLVGYYRTEEDQAFQLNAQDAALAKECFAKPYNVFLIVHLNKFGPPTATFFFHDRDCRMADFAFLEFPFDPSLLAAQQNDRIQRAQQAPSGDLLPEERSLAVAPSAPISAAGELRQLQRRVFIKAAGWTCLLALVFAMGMFLSNGSFREQYSHIWRAISNRPSSPQGKGSLSSAAQSPARPSISLRAIRRNADLELTWNRDSALIAAATSGTLWIQEGESTRQISFDAAELRDGSLLYSPRTDQILMRLTVATLTDTVTESVRVILPALGEPQTYPVPPLKNPAGSLAVSPAPPPRDAPIRPSKKFAVPLLTKGTSPPASPILQDPPAMNAGPSAPAALPSATLPIALDRLPVSPPAARLSQQLPSPSVTTYQPPVAVAKPQPAFPPELRNLIGKRMVVEVKVTIDKNGKVFKAEAVPQPNISKYWLNSAVDAALSWKFKPARSNSEPVWSEAIVQFVFNR